MTAAGQGSGPWPGLLPYDEKDSDRFFGRGPEVATIIRRIRSERIIVITGSSAAGKTSLLRAGVVPALRALRRQSRDDEYPEVGIPLVLRDWSLGGRTIDWILSDALDKALARLREEDKEEYEELMVTGRSHDGGFLRRIARLSKVRGGLILVFDQLEELLRLRRGVTWERRAGLVVDTIARIRQTMASVHTIISLRQEYHADLRKLETLIGGLYGRTMWLSPMAAGAVEDAIIGPAELEDIELDDTVAQEVIAWASGSEDVEAAEGSAETSKDAPVNLLSLQAILVDLYEAASREAGGGKVSRIQHETLRSLRRDGESAADFVNRALTGWIESAFLTPVMGTETGQHDIREPAKTELAKRITARMAPYLSASGFKVAMTEEDLLSRSLREDLLRLGMRPDQLEAALTRFRDPTASGPQPGDEFDPNRVSGEARTNGWGPAFTLDRLISVSIHALERLREKNVLKSSGETQGETWQLVHDGMGDPLDDWSEEQRGRFEDAVYALTVARGDEISADSSRDKPSLVADLNWWGCWVGPTGNDSEALFEGVEFRSCDLRGTLMDRCTFRDVRFKDCRLDGTLFKRCVLDTVSFVDCESDGMSFFGGTLGKVSFEPRDVSRASLAHLIVQDVELAGLVRLNNINLWSSTFSDLRPTDQLPSDRMLIEFNSCELLYSFWDEGAIKLSVLNDTRTVKTSFDPDPSPIPTES